MNQFYRLEHIMSLWLDAMLTHLSFGKYQHIREHILPMCPIPLPDCLKKEFEYGERCCNNSENDRLFPIRFLWFLEAHEQRMFGYEAGARSHYHPEKLLEFWERANSDASFLQEQTANGFRFDMKEKAINMSAGWVLIGDDLAGDFLEIEKTLKVEMIFSNYPGRSPQPAFSKIKLQRASDAPTS
jgi:hypothetical protein